MRPVVWINSQVHPLPLPGGAVGGDAEATNEHSDIVGTVVIPDPDFGFVPQATLWKNDSAFLLRDVVTNPGDWHLRQAEHINDRGQILVIAYSNTHSWQRVILTPIPEPAAALLALVGATPVVMARRGRRPVPLAPPVLVRAIPLRTSAWFQVSSTITVDR